MASLPSQFWRRRKLFALVFTLVFVAVVVPILVTPPLYSASGAVIIGEQEPMSNTNSAAWIQKLGDPADLESQLLIIRSPRMQRLALARPGVVDAVQRECRRATARRFMNRIFGDGVRCEKLERDSQDLLDFAQQRYGIGAVGRSRVISISYQSVLPDVAFMLANALIVTYLEDQRVDNAQSREAASSWLRNEVEHLDSAANVAADPPPTAGILSVPTEAGAAPLVDPPAPRGGAQDQGSVAPGLGPKRDFYLELYRKASDLETERRVPIGSARLVNIAELPTLPIFPRKAPVIAAGLTLALLLALAASIARDVTDRTVRGSDELETLTGVPTLVQLPLILPVPLRHSQVSSWYHRPPWSHVTVPRQIDHAPMMEDALRALYAKLRLAEGGKAPHRILLTSAAPGEGKTFTTVALAKVIAASGHTVLVVDCNLRRPTVARALHIEDDQGLSEVLQGEIEPEDAIVATLTPDLFALTAGRSSTNSTELFMSERFGKLLAAADRYDVVLLDGPVSDLLMDAKIMAGKVSCVLCCARWGGTKLTDAADVVQDLRRAGAHVFGTVVTMVRPSEQFLFESRRASACAYTESG